MSEIKIYGTRWCGDCRRALRILNEYKVNYLWIDIDKDPQGENFVKSANKGYRSVPTILFPDGSTLVEPPNKILKEKLDQLKD